MNLRERLKAAEARNPLAYATTLILTLDASLVLALWLSQPFVKS